MLLSYSREVGRGRLGAIRDKLGRCAKALMDVQDKLFDGGNVVRAVVSDVGYAIHIQYNIRDVGDGRDGFLGEMDHLEV